MSNDVFDGWPTSGSPQAARATNGGKQEPKDMHNYQPPKGPSNIGDPKSPGLHGTNHGNAGTQGRH